ncbi:MAG TPA: hypothetical protein P5567_11575 [Kiritimatiellia bacterium]|nr:hypothetical protein [Kiritimatiellia bacterium]HSA17501.1 hypothetical protein [Kiritimatiellia bacterium]
MAYLSRATDEFQEAKAFNRRLNAVNGLYRVSAPVAIYRIRAEQLPFYEANASGGKPAPPNDIPRLDKTSEALRELATESRKKSARQR